MGWRQKIAQFIAGEPQRARRRGARMYGGARQTLTTGGFGGGTTSADTELQTSLMMLRSRSRQMVRDSAYARRAKSIITNNTVGTGVAIQAMVRTTRGEPARYVNDDIEWQWHYWMTAATCHTGGTMHFHDLERALMGEVFETGEALVRLHMSAFGGSRVPLALELIESERLPIGEVQPGPLAEGNEVRMGVEVDRFGRPVAYWLREGHPGDLRGVRAGTERLERVPADQILHIKITSRWPQTRGEPWMAAVLRKLDDVNEYSQSEIAAARAAALYFGSVESPEDGDGGGTEELKTDTAADGSSIFDVSALKITEMPPGYKLNWHSPNRPNSAFADFMRAMLREIATGIGPGISYQALSADASQATYSSQRVAMLDERDGYKAVQQWWVRVFREPLHRIWLRQAVLARAVTTIPIEAYALTPQRYEAVRFKLRGWSWVDPTKEVAAYKEAVRAGFISTTDVVSQTAGGLDIEDVVETMVRERELFAQAGIKVDTAVVEPAAKAAAPAAAEPAEEDDDGDGNDEGDAEQRRLRRIA
jgi:lambda family phage portal protein